MTSKSSFGCPVPAHYPWCHSLLMLYITFTAIYLYFHLAHPFLSSGPAVFPNITSNVQHIPLPHPSVCQCLDKLPISFLFHPNRRLRLYHTPYFANVILWLILLLSGDIELNPGPTSLKFCHLNVHSASSCSPTLDKPTAIQEFITDHNLDLFAITETWLQTDSLPSTLNSLTPAGYSILHQPRPIGIGGGVTLIYCSFLKVIKIQVPIYTTFESLCTKLTISGSSFTLVTIYRPPNTSHPVFISELSSLLEDLASSNSEVLITGDFNIHVDILSDPFSKTFSNLLETFDLKQHITFPTHDRGHTLDLLITRSNSTIISDLDHTIPSISDHYAIKSSISVSAYPRPSRITKTIRSLHKINLEAFSNDILLSPIYCHIGGSKL